MEIISENKLPAGLGRKPPKKLKEGFVIALKTRDNSDFYVSRERVAGGGWYLDVIPNATKRDPAAQFLVTFRNKVVLFFLALFFYPLFLLESPIWNCTHTDTDYMFYAL
jgi:hypothetical protein